MVKLNFWRLATSMGNEFEIENLSICGVRLKIEKPTKGLKDMNSNIEYILNHIESLGAVFIYIYMQCPVQMSASRIRNITASIEFQLMSIS